MPRKYSFGVYYSRYWAYNDLGLMEIVKEYEQHNVPLDIIGNLKILKFHLVLSLTLLQFFSHLNKKINLKNY